jgi:hypothetical protein
VAEQFGQSMADTSGRLDVVGIERGLRSAGISACWHASREKAKSDKRASCDVRSA